MSDDPASSITLEAIQARAAELAPHVLHTPSLPLETQALGSGEMILKLELFQHTGTFKARGALSNARAIPQDRRAKGVTAASAGNHAIAAAWAARASGMQARVVMQNTANPFRVARARVMGAEVILKDPGPATFEEAERLRDEEGMTFIHPFDGVDTVLGTAGVGLELMQDVPGLDAVVVSVGGGGLISGVAAAVKQMNPDCAVYGIEPEGAANMTKSMASGAPITLNGTDTLADSLAPPYSMPLGYALCRSHVDDFVTLTDDEICAGMVVFAEDAKLAVEPAAGAALAGVLGPLRARLQDKRVGVIVCGANIDAAGYGALMARGQNHVAALRG
ncbi:MAG: pyridoxal-phosphate dependent enzyme [Pseudomonadota bacterium]